MTIVFLVSFFLFFYLTLFFKNIFYGDKNDKEKDTISILSNNILHGTHGIFIFNGLFSVFFSYFYLISDKNDIKTFLFEKNINIIFMPIVMNKFYYFTLTYYSIFTGEKEKNFEMLSVSTLISMYVAIYNVALSLIKAFIPDEKSSNNFDYNNILYIIQISVSFLPFFGIIVFIFMGIIISSGLDVCLSGKFEYQDCKRKCVLHQFLFWLISCFICFGGLWNKMNGFKQYSCEGCNLSECCYSRSNCYVYCINNSFLMCDCFCCDRRSGCYSQYCYKNYNMFKISCCLNNKNNNNKEEVIEWFINY